MAFANSDLTSFLGEVRQIYKPEAPGSFWQCEPLLERLLKSSFLPEVINEELGRMTKGDGDPDSWLANELVLHRGAGFALSLSIFETPQRYIHSLPYYAMYAAVGTVDLFCNVYRFPDGYNNAVFDPALRLTPERVVRLAPGSIIALKSDTYAYDFSSKEATPLLKFMTTAIQPLEWLFTRSGMQAWQANDADLSFTQLRVAADVLGTFAHQSSLQPLKRLARHPHHAVRWAAIQNVARLSRTEAVALLAEAVNDRHPHVQRAAQKTLAKLQAK
jgi:hypothetical protein